MKEERRGRRREWEVEVYEASTRGCVPGPPTHNHRCQNWWLGGPCSPTTRPYQRKLRASSPPALLSPSAPPTSRLNLQPFINIHSCFFTVSIDVHQPIFTNSSTSPKPLPKPIQNASKGCPEGTDCPIASFRAHSELIASNRLLPPLARLQPVRPQPRRRRLARRPPRHLATRRSAPRPGRRRTARTSTRVRHSITAFSLRVILLTRHAHSPQAGAP